MIHQDVFCALICTPIPGSLSHRPNRISGVLGLGDSAAPFGSARLGEEETPSGWSALAARSLASSVLRCN